MKLKIALSLVAVALATQTLNLRAQTDVGRLVVHEWGTFTSLQGGDGNLIPWRGLQSSALPKFVYKWANSGLPIFPTSPILYGGKGMIVSLQRMETPVVYFYSDREQTVDLAVKFPSGMITEWFPEANQIGPSALKTNLIADASAERGQTTESLIRWSNLKLMPAQDQVARAISLPIDTTGTHYFAARETDADVVRASAISTNNTGAEFEKFLFYRGVGNFATPLRVSMPDEGMVILTNTGKETLSHLFILGVKSKAGNFVYVPQLLPGEEKTIALNTQIDALSPSALSDKISRDVSQALAQTGLYPREADAMVKTWRDSWFAEDGVRVLYVLPQTWTERTLPMSLNPAPNQLVRVMVGRAEVLTPHLVSSLAQQLQKAGHGDTAASDQARATLKGLGRFAEPAFTRALAAANIQPQDQMKLTGLLNDVRTAE